MAFFTHTFKNAIQHLEERGIRLRRPNAISQRLGGKTAVSLSHPSISSSYSHARPFSCPPLLLSPFFTSISLSRPFLSLSSLHFFLFFTYSLSPVLLFFSYFPILHFFISQVPVTHSSLHVHLPLTLFPSLFSSPSISPPLHLPHLSTALLSHPSLSSSHARVRSGRLLLPLSVHLSIFPLPCLTGRDAEEEEVEKVLFLITCSLLLRDAMKGCRSESR